jgi:hypothetical protein
MSKFDAVFKRIEENSGLAVTPNQQAAGAGVPPKPVNNQQQLNQQQLIKAIIAAKDDKDAQAILQTLTNPQQTQQQKPATGTQPQPAV